MCYLHSPPGPQTVPAPSVLMTLAPCVNIASRQLATPLMAAKWNLEGGGQRSEVRGDPWGPSLRPSPMPLLVQGTHADLPSGSSLVGTSPLRVMSAATRAGSLFSTACSSRSSLLLHSWLCGAYPERGVGPGGMCPLPTPPGRGSGPSPPVPGHLPGACLWLPVSEWGRGRRVGRNQGQWG